MKELTLIFDNAPNAPRQWLLYGYNPVTKVFTMKIYDTRPRDVKTWQVLEEI